MTKRYPLHHEDAEPLYKEIPQDEYDRINSRIAELEEERRWRKFSEEKPNEKQWILVSSPNHSQFTTGVEVARWDNGLKLDVEYEVYTHWMTLPSAPEEKNERKMHNT